MKTFLLTLFCIGSLANIYVSCDYNGKQTWNYVKVRDNAHMFWWLYCVDVPGNDYEKYPLVIWLQGGPGSSSCGFGNFGEIGPLDVSLVLRNSTWLQKVNILFIDNPVGTGYSYVDNLTALATNNDQISNDLVTLMKSFLDKVPEFQKVPLYIFSESYGGKMTASFALALYQTKKAGKINCNFKGIALGDSWISPIDSVASWQNYLFATSLIDQNGMTALSSIVDAIREALKNKQFANATTLWSSAEDLVGKLTDGVDFYNILKRGQTSVSKANSNQLIKDNALWKLYLRHVAPMADDALSDLMNGKIKTKLQIIPPNVTWGGQSAEVFKALSGDFMLPVTKVVETILNTTDLKVAVYSGQLDLIVDVIGTMKWVENLRWPGMKAYAKADRTPFNLNDKSTAGFSKTYKNLEFYWILDAGHMVPADAGDAALRMLKMITKDAFKK